MDGSFLNFLGIYILAGQIAGRGLFAMKQEVGEVFRALNERGWAKFAIFCQ